MDNLKTIDEICIEADNANEIEEILALHRYVCKHGRQYPLVQFEFMNEHFHLAGRALGRRHGAEIKEILGPLFYHLNKP